MPSEPKTRPGKRRANRAHGAMDRLPEEIRLQVKDWYMGRPNEQIPVPRLTYDQISAELGNLGYKISRSQVHRWLSRQRNELDRLERTRERAQALAAYLVPDGSDVEGAAVALANALCLEALADADITAVQSISDLSKVSHSLGKLQTSAVARDRWEIERRKKIEEAVARMKAEVQRILDGRPELTRDLLDVIYEAEAALME